MNLRSVSHKPDKPGGPMRRVTNTGVNISDPCLPPSALRGLHCPSCDFTWLAKPEKQTSQPNLLMQQCTSSV